MGNLIRPSDTDHLCENESVSQSFPTRIDFIVIFEFVFHIKFKYYQ